MHGLGVIQNRHSAPPRLQLHCQRAVCVALSRGCDCPAESPERMPRDLLDDMGDIPSPRDLIHDRLIVLTTSLESRLDRLDRSISQVLAMASYIQHHINSFQLTPIDPIAQMPHKPQPAPPAPSPQTECDSPNDCEFPNCTCETIETVDTLEAAGIIEPSRAEEIDVDAAENAVEHNSNTLPGSDSRPVKDWKEMRGPYAKVHDQSDVIDPEHYGMRLADTPLAMQDPLDIVNAALFSHTQHCTVSLTRGHLQTIALALAAYIPPAPVRGDEPRDE